MNGLTLRSLQRNGLDELYLTWTPPVGGAASDARDAAAALGEYLDAPDVVVLQSRIFAASGAEDGEVAALGEALSSLAGGMPPVVLRTGRSQTALAAQVYAVRGGGRQSWVQSGPSAWAQTLTISGRRHVTGAVAPGGTGASPAEQAESMFRAWELLMRRLGLGFDAVARTWMWLEDILDWYGAFNDVRNAFYERVGLIGTGELALPASTGVGVGPAAGGKRCCMEFIAVDGEDARRESLMSAGKQSPAYDYGSAFSRALWARTPAGRALYVSGTAAIDAAGRMTHVGDPAGQIRDVLNNVRAVLRQGGCEDSEIVHAVAYCKTPEIEKLFRAEFADAGFPFIVTVGDICREDWLFEIETTACPGAGTRRTPLQTTRVPLQRESL